MINVSASYKWAVNTCNAPNVGYSQGYRNQQTVGGITYYDCASFVWYSLLAGGFDVVKAYNETMWTYTGNAFTVSYMDRCLKYLGFTRYNAKTQDWAKGDILTIDGHTEMVYDAINHRAMGAHSADRPLADQVSISEYSSPRYWTYGYHYGGQVVTEGFNAKNTGKYSRDSVEAQNNADNIYNFLTQKGWSKQAICGLLANIELESGYNPFKWENDTPRTPSSNDGYGLIQFKPCGTYINDIKAVALEHYEPYYIGHAGKPDDGFAQLDFINRYLDFQPTEEYELDYTTYKSSTLSVSTMATIFYKNGLHKTTDVPDVLSDIANYWEEYLDNVVPVDPDPTDIIKKKLPIYYYIKPFL